MPCLIGTRLARAAATRRRGTGAKAALEVLDSLLATSRGSELDAGADWLIPSSPFGQVLAEAFDAKMSPAEWAAWSAPPADPPLRFAILDAWRSVVLEPFARHFDLVLVGGEILGPPPPHTPQPAVNQSHSISAWQLYHAGELLPGLPLHKVVDAIIQRPPGAGLLYVWGRDRGIALNEPRM